MFGGCGGTNRSSRTLRECLVGEVGQNRSSGTQGRRGGFGGTNCSSGTQGMLG